MKAVLLLIFVSGMALVEFGSGAKSAEFEEAYSNKKHLQSRVIGYYRALQDRKLETVWSDYLDASMQRDNPKEEYIERLRQTLGEAIIRVQAPDITFRTTGVEESKRIVALASTRIRIGVPGEGEYQAEHITSWILRRERGSNAWYLVGDEINERPSFTKGMVHSDKLGEGRIREVQSALKARGYDPGPEDGVMGPKTQQALRDFQRSLHIKADGELDSKTRQALGVSRSSSENPSK